MSNVTTKHVSTASGTKPLWVHSFLNCDEQLVTKTTDDAGIREYKLLDKHTKIMTGDVIIKWGDNKQIKTLHRAVSPPNYSSIEGVGLMEDVILLDKLSENLIRCIISIEEE